MPLPEADLDRIRKWVTEENDRIGEHIDQMRIEMDVARLRFERSIGWTLYWADRNSEFHVYDGLAPTSKVQRLLDEINDDPTCIFWG